MPVFCGECVFYITSSEGDGCDYKSNLIEKLTYRERTFEYVELPSKINRNNDCPNFKCSFFAAEKRKNVHKR